MEKQLTKEQIEMLKSPLPKGAVKPHPTKNYLSSIKAIYVVERFNEVFGIGGWFINNEVVESNEKHIVVKSTFHAPTYGIVIPDIFGGNDNSDRGDAYKGACTDALTKIGSYLYVGMDVYKGLNDAPATNGQPKQDTYTPGRIEPNPATKTSYPEDTRPWLSEKQFDSAIERINNGEVDLYAKLDKEYRMKKAYREALLGCLNLENALQNGGK